MLQRDTSPWIQASHLQNCRGALNFPPVEGGCEASAARRAYIGSAMNQQTGKAADDASEEDVI
jgi:hypothetical protein